MDKKIIKFIHKKLEYYEQIKDTSIIKKFIKENKINLSVEDIIEIRNLYMHLLSNSKGTLANKLGDKIFSMYQKKESILNIAKKYSLPPYSVLYQILIELKNETQNIEKKLNTGSLPTDLKDQFQIIKKTIPKKWLPSYSNEIKKLIISIKKISKCKIIGHIVLFDKIICYNNKVFIWIYLSEYILFDYSLQLKRINLINNKYRHIGPGLILYPKIFCTPSFIKKNNIEKFTFITKN